MYIKTCMLTQPSRWRIDNTPWCLVDIADSPYITKSIKDKLFEVVFLNKNDFFKNMNPIIKEAKYTISDCFFGKTFREWIYVELLENIHKHANENANEKFLSTISIKKEANQYIAEILNFCETKDFQRLLSSLSINDMTLEDILKAYSKQILKWELSEKWWAWLWILTIARDIKRHNKHQFNIIDIKELWRINTSIVSPEWKEELELIKTKITINIPFPNEDGKVSSPKNNQKND